MHKPKLLILDDHRRRRSDYPRRDYRFNQRSEQTRSNGSHRHHLESLERIANKLTIVHNGKVCGYGQMEEVLQPYMKENFVFNLRVGKDKERLINLIKRLPDTKIIDQGHQLSISADNSERAMIALMRIIKEEHLYLHDLDLHKPSLKEVLTKIAQQEPLL